MGALDNFTPVKAALGGVVLSIANPKNLLLIVGGGAALAQFGLSSGDKTVSWIVFTVIASIGVGAPVVIYFAMGDRAAAILDELKTWMARNNGAVMAERRHSDDAPDPDRALQPAARSHREGLARRRPKLESSIKGSTPTAHATKCKYG